MLPVPPNVPLMSRRWPTASGCELAVQENCPAVPVIVTPVKVNGVDVIVPDILIFIPARIFSPDV